MPREAALEKAKRQNKTKNNKNFPKHIYYTYNPKKQGHQYIKRLFIDKQYKPGENPDEYAFIQALVDDNTALMESQPDYLAQLEALPKALREDIQYMFS